MKRIGLLGLFGLLWGLLLGGCSREAPYQLRQGRWTFEGQPVAGADTASFQALNATFARDHKTGYYRGVAIPDSEGESFQALSENDARDSRTVWYADTYRKGQEYWTIKHQRVSVVAGADAASYRHLGEDYTVDRHRAYYTGLPFAVRDAASFEVLGSGYTRDRLRGYFERQEIAGSDGARMVLLDIHESRHAQDGQRVYYADIELGDPKRRAYPLVRVLTGASPATTQALGRGYAIDGTRLFHRGLPLKDADAASFEVVHGSTSGCPTGTDARDSRGCWDSGRRVAAEPASAAAR
jgi:DKNYY family